MSSRFGYLVGAFNGLHHWLKANDLDPDTVTVTLTFANRGDMERAKTCASEQAAETAIFKDAAPPGTGTIYGIPIRFAAAGAKK